MKTEAGERAPGDFECRVVGPALAKALLTIDMLSPKRLLGIEPIVRTADDAQVRRVVASAKRTWVDVIDLEVRPRRAAVAAFVFEGALLAVAFEHLTSHGAGHAVANAFFLELGEKRVESLVEHGLEVAT